MDNHVACATMELFEARERRRREQQQQGGVNVVVEEEEAAAKRQGNFGECYLAACDEPETRDATSVSTMLEVRAAFHVFNDLLTAHELDESIAAAQARLEPYNMRFAATKHFHTANNATFGGVCMSAFDQGDLWMTQLANLKASFALEPATTINIFVGCQDESADGGALLGIGTFPWDAIWNTFDGGIWVNSIAMSPDDPTLVHEFGHNIGLWHTFHGVSEVAPCSACYEFAHNQTEKTSAPGNRVGDLCSDTVATPLNYYCEKPTHDDCEGEPFADVNTLFPKAFYNNWMGYNQLSSWGFPDQCTSKFTPQQNHRAHCFLQNVESAWLVAN